MSADMPSVSLTPSRKRSRVPAFISWAVILGLVGLVVYKNARPGDAADNERLLNNERARMVGMLVVQLKAVEKDAGATRLSGQRMESLIAQIEGDARTPEDRIRVAILAGESLGSDAALAKLSRVSENDIEGELAGDIRSIRTIYEDGADALSAAERESLVRRHGYLGRLALAHDIPADVEPRKTLQSEAFWFTVRLSFLAVGLVLLLGLSLILFAIGCIWFFKGRIRRAYVPDASSNGAFLEGFALYIVLFVALGPLLRWRGSVSVHWTWIALLILPIVWLWTGRRGTTFQQRLHAFGWHRGQGFLREAGAGIAGYIAGLVVIAVGCLVTVVLVRYTGINASSPIVRELDGGPLQLVGLYALACVFAPVMEEAMFRGALFHHLRQRWGWAASAFVVSFIFAILHPQGWVALPALFSIAMVLAALREWRGSLIAPMAAHACSNFLVLTLALVLLK
jgi:membrane protease YdiL (CAAX protease family)